MNPRSHHEGDESEGFLDALLSTAFATDPELESPGSRAAVARTPERPETIGPYAVLDPLGSGGVATIWRVFDGELERELAVKLLRPELKGDAEMERRLAEEARITSRLDHPGIVAVHSRGLTDDGRPYFAMRLVEGQTLAELFAARGDGDARARLEVFEKVASALAHAHQRGIVHGDVKPQNVMVGAFGEVQLMDWGFAFERETGEPDPRAAKRRVGGTPAYMSPEQARGDRSAISPRTDVFGLGAILCEMLTGAPPYRGATKREVVAQATLPALDDAHARLRSCDAGAALVEIATSCLAADPKQRPAEAGFVARSIGRYLSDLEARARSLEIEAAAANARADQEKRARRLGHALAVTIVGISLLACVLWIVWQNARARRDETTQRGFAALLERAETLYEQARLDPLGEHDLWERTIAAAREADTWLRAREGSVVDRTAASDLLARAENESTVASRQRDVRDRILVLRAELVDDDHLAEAEQRYAALFRELGLEVDAAVVAPVREAILASPIREHLIQALHAWVHLRRRTKQPDPEAWKRTFELVRKVDADPLREALRSAYAESDVAKFLGILAELKELSRFPAHSSDLIASCLKDLGRKQDAIEFLRRALAAYPGDANLAHRLASYLSEGVESPGEEVERLLWMAHAVRPSDTHLICDLARTLILRERSGEALGVLDRAKGLVPADRREEFFRGWAMIENGAEEAGEAVLRKAALGGCPHSAVALSKRVGERGCVAAARRWIELAAAQPHKPREVEAMRAGFALDCRDFPACAILAERAIQLDPRDPTLRAILIGARLRCGELGAATDALEAWREGIERGVLPAAELVPFEEQIAATRSDLARLDAEGVEAGSESPQQQIRLSVVAQSFGRYALAYELATAAIDGGGESLPPGWYCEAGRSAWGLARATPDPGKAKAMRAQALEHMLAELEVIRAAGTAPNEALASSLCVLLSTFLFDPEWNDARAGGEAFEPAERDAWRELFAEVEAELRSRGCPFP